jgi:hypothetical protein
MAGMNDRDRQHHERLAAFWESEATICEGFGDSQTAEFFRDGAKNARLLIEHCATMADRYGRATK